MSRNIVFEYLTCNTNHYNRGRKAVPDVVLYNQNRARAALFAAHVVAAKVRKIHLASFVFHISVYEERQGIDIRGFVWVEQRIRCLCGATKSESNEQVRRRKITLWREIDLINAALSER